MQDQWIKVTEQMPKLFQVDDDGIGFSNTQIVWVVEDGYTLETGFLTTAMYSERWNGWIAEEGTLESQGFTVTHWLPMLPPPTE